MTMRKKVRRPPALLVRDAHPGRSVKPMADSQIDFADIPESSNEELRRAQRVGRPKTGKAKQLIAFRISPVLLAKLRKLAARQNKPYQTTLHELLEAGVKKAAALPRRSTTENDPTEDVGK